MGKHRKPTRRSVPVVATGLAIPAVGLLGFVHATDAHVTDLIPAASTAIFVDGTKSVTGNEEGDPPFRMADSFMGAYATPNVDAEKFVFYPRSLGLATGFGDPAYDASEGLATDEVVALIRQAKQDPDYQQGDRIYVVGYSQGAGAAVNAIPELESEEFAGDDIEFVLAGSPRRNNGGILTRLPKGVYLPLFGVSFGEGTTPENIKVMQVTKAFDGVGDAPNFVFNVVADVNAVLGFYYLHPDYYKDVNPEDPTAIVTTSADGNVIDVFIPAKLGELPLTMPLLQLGVPKSIVEALDPFLRAVIETGYDRPQDGGTFASEPVPFRLFPPPTRWLSDVESVAAGAVQSAQALAALVKPPVSSGSTIALNSTVSAAPETAVEQVRGPDPATEATAREAGGGTSDTGEPATPAALFGGAARKFEPPRKPRSGWKPGDLLRSLPTPKQGASASSGTEPNVSEPEARAPGPAHAGSKSAA